MMPPMAGSVLPKSLLLGGRFTACHHPSGQLGPLWKARLYPEGLASARAIEEVVIDLLAIEITTNACQEHLATS